jgi:iron-sulfur cluster assembly accessory protein
MTDKPIRRQDNIQETVMKYPQTIDVFMSYGLHCVGCHISASESIEQGAYGHAMDDKTVDSLLEDLNAAVLESSETFDLKITAQAAEQIRKLMENENKSEHDLRINVTKDGHEMSYDFEFEKDNVKDDDHVFEFHGLHVFVSPSSFDLLKGTKIDYVSSDFEEGFRIQNPHDPLSMPAHR